LRLETVSRRNGRTAARPEVSAQLLPLEFLFQLELTSKGMDTEGEREGIGTHGSVFPVDFFFLEKSQHEGVGIIAAR
jgi:hypothetical protein